MIQHVSADTQQGPIDKLSAPAYNTAHANWYRRRLHDAYVHVIPGLGRGLVRAASSSSGCPSPGQPFCFLIAGSRLQPKNLIAHD